MDEPPGGLTGAEPLEPSSQPSRHEGLARRHVGDEPLQGRLVARRSETRHLHERIGRMEEVEAVPIALEVLLHTPYRQLPVVADADPIVHGGWSLDGSVEDGQQESEDCERLSRDLAAQAADLVGSSEYVEQRHLRMTSAVENADDPWLVEQVVPLLGTCRACSIHRH